MKAGRFLKLYQAKRRVAFIKAHLEVGHMVQLTTYTKAVRYTQKHIGWFKATKSRAVQRYLLKVIENMDLRPPRAAA
jgi:hypothetical protein